MSAQRIRTRSYTTYAALHTLLHVDGKIRHVDSYSWAVLLQSRWLTLVFASAAAAGGGGGGGGGGARRARRGAITAEALAPTDPCFETRAYCDELQPGDYAAGAGRSARLRARLRARSEELIGRARDAVGSVRSAMPELPSLTDHLPSVPDVVPQRVRERVRGWWRTARDRTGYRASEAAR